MSDCKSRKERVVKEKWEEMFDKKFYMETDNGSGPECLHKVHPDGSVSFATPDHVKEFIRGIRTDGSVSGIRGMSDSREGMTPENLRAEIDRLQRERDYHQGNEDGLRECLADIRRDFDDEKELLSWLNSAGEKRNTTAPIVWLLKIREKIDAALAESAGVMEVKP